MSFEALDKPISELLNKVTYHIPRNQRRYVWKKENWEELLEDIYFTCQNGTNIHFLGSVVFQDLGSQNGLKSYTIIDGQQRLTTVSIILLVIMKLFNERRMEDEFFGTVDYVLTKNNRNQPNPVLNSDYHISLERLIESTVALESDSVISVEEFLNTNIIDKSRDSKIAEAYKFFYKNIREKIEMAEDGNEELLIIRDAVIGMVLIQIVSSTEEDSYTVFEILNARGQELEDHELLKNYIMRYIVPNDYRDAAKSVWESMENRLGTYMKKFVYHYAWHKFDLQGQEDLTPYRIIQKGSKGSDIKKLLEDLNRKSEYYCKFIVPSEENCLPYEIEIFRFFKNKRQEQFRPLILSLIHQKELGKLSDSYYEQALKYIYNFFVCYTIIGEEKSNKLRDTVLKYASLLENSYSDTLLFEFGASLKRKIPSYEWFENSFKNLGWSNHTEMFKGQKNKQRVQIALEIIEKFCSQRDSIDDFTIEHILPDSESAKYAQIGNLIPLEQKINERCDNRTLDKKLVEYQKSNFYTARGIVNQCREKEFVPEKRTMYLARLVYNNILELNQLEFH